MIKGPLRQALPALLLAGSISFAPTLAHAQQADTREDDGVFVLGSVLLSILHVPLKLVTCVGTQATAAVATQRPTMFVGVTTAAQMEEILAKPPVAAVLDLGLSL